MADKNVLFHGLDLRLTEIASNVHGISQVPYGKTVGGVFVPLTADADGNLSVVSAASGIADLVTLLARIGEVQASPTANTILDRLKTLAATLATETTAATLATEATLAAQLNITLSALRDALAGVAPATVGDLGLILDQLDVTLSTIASEATLSALAAEDFATQTTLAAVLAKIIAAPATEAKQDTLIAKDFATQTTLAAVLAKIIAAPATEAKQDTLIAKDFATQTTLAAILAKIIAAPATEATLAALASEDFATQTTLAAVLAKIIAAPATEAKQDTLIAKDFATQTTLAAVLAKIIAAPATEAKQDTLIAKDFATQTTLAAVLAKIIAAPATEAKQDTLIAKDFATQTTLATLVADATFTGRVGEVQASPTANTVLARLKDLKTSVDLLATQATLASIKDTDGIKKITDTVNVAMTGSTSTTTATIANGASLSGEADIGAYTYVAIMMPAAWTAANLTLQASNASAGTFYDVYDDAGIEVQVLADASRVIGLDLAALKLAALRYIKVRSGTTGTPVAQGAERVLTLILKK